MQVLGLDPGPHKPPFTKRSPASLQVHTNHRSQNEGVQTCVNSLEERNLKRAFGQCGGDLCDRETNRSNRRKAPDNPFKPTSDLQTHWSWNPITAIQNIKNAITKAYERGTQHLF